MTGCTHWHREPDTDNSIIFAFKVSKRPQCKTNKILINCSNISFLQAGFITTKDRVEVYRYVPENHDYSNPEIVAAFIPHKVVEGLGMI